MAWISSESFYRRLIHNMEQHEIQESSTFKAMQEELEALTRDRDELYDWKEAHCNERKDSGACVQSKGCRNLQARNLVLEKELMDSRQECNHLRAKKEELLSSKLLLKDKLREAKRLRESFDALEAAHHKLKKSNEELKAHFAVVSQDLESKAQACEELECSKDVLQQGFDEAKTELQTHKKTISNFLQASKTKNIEISSLTSQLQQAREDVRGLEQIRAELESQIGETGEELLIHAARSDQREDDEKQWEDLRSKYDQVCAELQQLADAALAPEKIAERWHLDSFDNLSERLLGAMLVLLIAFGIFGVVTGRLA